MSTISTLFDTIKSAATATLSSHYVLSNPYNPEENDELSLNQGVGVAFGSGQKSDREIDNHLWIRRSFSIVVTRRFFATELNTSDKETTEKDLFEDQKLLIIKMMQDPLVGISNSVAKLIFISDNGIETIFGEADNFLKLVSNFEVEYRETIF